MSVPSQAGEWSFAPQPAKVGKDGTFDVADYDWQVVNTMRNSLSGIVDEQQFPLEIGGVIVPPDMFRQAHFYAGEIDIIPRIENTMGWLLYALLGNVESTADTDMDGNSVTGVHTHRFRFDEDSSYSIPWLASRCLLPASNPANNTGEIGFDCKVASMRITVPQMGKVAIRVSLQGRESEFDNSPSDWTFVGDYEFGSSSPDAGRGSFKMEGTEYPALGATIMVNNALTNLQQEVVIGSMNPDDFTPLTRNAGVQWVYKYEDSDLAQRVLTGDVDGTTVISLPSYIDTVGDVKALDIRFNAPENIPGTSQPYRMAIQADRGTLSKNGATELVAGDILTENYTVNLINPGTGKQYVEIVVENAIPSYAWPTAFGDANVAPVVVLGAIPILIDTTTATYIFPETQVYDVDSDDFDTGTLTVEGSTVATEDLTLATGGGVEIVTTNVEVDGVVIGVVTTTGAAGVDLVITFNALATVSIVERVVRAVTLETSQASAGTVGPHDLTLTDGDGGSITKTGAYSVTVN
jgi:hypothetical protein